MFILFGDIQEQTLLVSFIFMQEELVLFDITRQRWLVRCVLSQRQGDRMLRLTEVVEKSQPVLLFLPIGAEDEQEDCRHISEKIASLGYLKMRRKMNLSCWRPGKRFCVFPSLLFTEIAAKGVVQAFLRQQNRKKPGFFTNNYVVC